jgi:quercetin dioxygenase-like cupin family protein
MIKMFYAILMMFGFFPVSAFSQNPSAERNAAIDSSNSESREAQNSFQALKPELENDAVQVLRIVIGPHEKVPMHRISPRVIVWVSNGRLRLTLPDGKTLEEAHSAGDVEWLNAQEHAGENLGNQAIELLAIILKK